MPLTRLTNDILDLERQENIVINNQLFCDGWPGWCCGVSCLAFHLWDPGSNPTVDLCGLGLQYLLD